MSAPNFDAVYQFKTVVQRAAALFVAAQNIAVYTRTNESLRTPAWLAENPTLVDYVLSTLVFQKQRPRLEIYYDHGQETGHVNPTNFRPDCWTGNLSVVGVTAPKDEEHEQYIARVRNVMVRLRTSLFNDRTASTDLLLPWHCILDMVESGTSGRDETQDGYYLSNINYAIKINIRPTAWPAEE